MSEPFVERRYTTQDGLRLYYRDYPGPTEGAGMPVLCLTGLSRNSKDFAVLAQKLSAKRRVVCPDYRGRGRSDYAGDWRSYHPRTYLGDLTHLLIVARLHGFAAIGTSLGGLMAMAIAVAAPGSLRGAVLNDIGPEFEGGSLAKIVQYVGKDAPQPDLESATAFLKAAFGEIGFRDEDTWRRFADAGYRRGDDGLLHVDWDPAIARPLAATANELPDLWSLFAALGRVPVLAVRGEASTILSARTLQEMARRHPGLKHVTVAGLGHAPSLDEPEAAEAIDAFLDDLDRRHGCA